MNVFWALITMIGRSGRIRLMRGSKSKALSSGMTTSVMIRSPSPAATHRHSPATFLVARTSSPALVRAWFNTVRIPASSSATSICPDGMPRAPSQKTRPGAPSLRGEGAWRLERHQNAKRRPARMRLALDDAAMVADQLCDQCKTQTRTVRLGGDERVEQVGVDFRRDPLAIVAHADFERQRDRLGARSGAQSHAWAKGGRQRNFAIKSIVTNGFRRILD